MPTYPDDPAYPHLIPEGHEAGLTKREYFAAQTLNGLLSGVLWVRFTASSPWQPAGPIDDLPAIAVRMADELITRLNES